jgi:NtrC-family two-component system response regulator AlgB
MRVLIVDDEPNIRHTLRIALEALGQNLGEACSSMENSRQVYEISCDLVFVDLHLGNKSVCDLAEALRKAQPRLLGVVMNGNPSIAALFRKMRRESLDDEPGPYAPVQVTAVVENPIHPAGPGNRVAELECRARAVYPESNLESTDPQVRRTMAQARIVAPSDASLLIRGEKGTGKSSLARAIHAWSKRSSGPFVTVICASLSPEPLECELFGHVRGAFTDAVGDAAGMLTAAEGGTLFLHEVGAIPPELQPKLLRLLQDQKYERAGEAGDRSADVRVVAATSQDLEAAVSSGAFHQELLYRLNLIELTLPPLRHRSDVCALADHLLAFFARQTGNRFTGFVLIAARN